MKTVDEVISILRTMGHSPRKTGKGWKALCPAHDDSNPSLSIGEGADGKLLLKCHAGCKYKDIIKGIGINTNGPAPKASTPQKKIVAEYGYRDEEKNLLYQVVRFEPKGFSQRRPDGAGGWIWKLDRVRRVLYRLPELVEAIGRDQRIYLVEGEKDADRLRSEGLAATTNAGGASKWRDEYAESLRGARICILPDNDVPGKKHAQKLALSLHGVAAELKIVNLENLPPKADVSDWFSNGGTRKKLERLADEASVWDSETEGVDINPLTIPGIPHLTDAGNAERLVKQHGKNLHYCHASATWYVWDGKRWKADTTGKVRRLALETVRNIYKEAGTIEDKSQRLPIAQFAVSSESEHKLKAMVSIAKYLKGIPVTPEEFDTDPWLLNCSNGTLSLRTEKLHPPRREDLITKMIPIEYDRDAKCPIWDGFLEETMDGDLDLICFLHRMAGYMLTGSTGEQKMFFLYGTGCNGKSTLLDTLMHVMGDYARPVASDLLMLRREDSHPTALADLQGIRMATCAEVEQGRRMAEVRVKELTGMTSHKSLIKARRMRQDYYEFEATHKLVVCGNHKPIIKGTDEGIWRRMDLIPFNVKITEPDKELPEKLLEEAPGILRWCVRGCGDWRLHGLAEPPAVQDATKTYRTEMDILGEFIVDTCVIDPNAKSTAASLYDEYKQWCVENKEYAMSKRKFGSALKERGFDQRHDGKDRSRTWFGIGLRTDANG